MDQIPHCIPDWNLLIQISLVLQLGLQQSLQENNWAPA